MHGRSPLQHRCTNKEVYFLMNNLTTRKIVLGMLMALVLAFSVQGTADALKFGTSRTGDLQTALPNQPNGFKIRFSVTLGSNTTRITNANGDTVSDDGTLLDSSGYQINSDGHRVNSEDVAIDSSGFKLDVNGHRVNSEDVAIDSSGFKLDVDGHRVTVTISGKTFYTLVDESGNEATVDSSRYKINANGHRVNEDNRAIDTSGYLLNADGARQKYDHDGDSNTPEVDQRADEGKRTQVRITGATQFKPANTMPVKATAAERYHYNEEAVTITVADAYITKVGRYEFTGTSKITHTLFEQGKDDTKDKLSGSVEVTFNATAAAVVQITITDATPTDDAPANGKADPIGFTVYVVQPQSAVQTATTTLGSNDGVEYAFDNEDRQIDDYFTFNPAANAPVNYSVEGSGRVYISLGGDRRTRSASTLWTSSSAPVFLETNRGTSKVTAYISGTAGKTALFMFSGPSPDKYPEIEITQGNPQTGATEARLEDYLEVKVTDGNNRPVAGVAVAFATRTNSVGSAQMFIPVPGTTVYTMITDVDLVDEDDTAKITVATSNRPAPSETIWVQTDRSGVAQVYYQLGNIVGAHQVTAALEGEPRLTTTFDADAVDASRSASLVVVSGDNQRSDADTHDVEDPLVVRVRRPGGYRIAGVKIRFTALSGVLARAPGTLPPTTEPIGPSSGQEIYGLTNAHGEAAVIYNTGQIAGAKTVTARVDDELSEEQYNYQIRQVEFNIDGGGSTARPPADDEDEDEPSVMIDVPPTVTGTAGETARLTVTAPATATVTAGGLNDNFPLASAGSFTQSGTTFTSTLTLPDQVTSYSLSVFVNNTRYPVTVSTTAAPAQTGGTLTVAVNPFSGAPGSTATVTVTANDSSAQSANVTVNLTATGGTLSSSSVATGTAGTTTVTLTRGSTVGSENFVTVSGPSGYTSKSGRYIIAGPAGSDTTVGEAAEVDVYDGNNQDGSLNSRLAEPFIVEVVDANDNPVEDARVRFRTTIGSGRFSPRTPRTDEDGFAETTFTPTSAGRIRVVATVAGADSTAAFIVQAGEPADALEKVSGDNQTGTPGNALANPFVVEVQDEDGEPLSGHSVTFSVTAGGGSLSATSARTNANGRAQTTLTLGSALGVNSVQASVSGVDSVTFSTSIDAQILVAAANRPVMYWIAGGGLYSLSGAKEAKIAESANGVAVGGGKIYWTSQVNASSGAINSANLDGTNAAVLTSILAVPMGISVDTAGSKLYWTNTRGRIQSANLNGSGIQNVLLDLSDPTDIVVSNGFIYWTEGGNSVRRVNISGQKIAIDVAVNLETVGGLAVGSGKVYWTEMTSATAGTVNGANLNGTNFETLATLLSAPMGISVDTAGSKLYWTNARGRVQSANLDGSMIKNVVEGLISPSKLAIGGANTETTTTAKKATTPAKKDNAKYDVNGDGTVDNTDASLVSAGFDTGNAKLDVNGDGKVSFLDLLLVFDNRDDTAAGAPTIVGMRLTAIQIDRIEEQIDLLIATNDRSPAALRTLVYMQQLLATARPGENAIVCELSEPVQPRNVDSLRVGDGYACQDHDI